MFTGYPSQKKPHAIFLRKNKQKLNFLYIFRAVHDPTFACGEQADININCNTTSDIHRGENRTLDQGGRRSSLHCSTCTPCATKHLRAQKNMCSASARANATSDMQKSDNEMLARHKCRLCAQALSSCPGNILRLNFVVFFSFFCWEIFVRCAPLPKQKNTHCCSLLCRG